MEPLTRRYSWFAATDPLIWLVNTGALVQPLADC
ncbi:MAG: hypothetical protein RJB26_2471, partial [Pseudomonadota bacterium]|jgi:hypothetical protein